MAIDLKELRTSKNIPAKDIVDVVKPLYPKYDKTLQSKCENGDIYGVCLLPDAMDAIIEKFVPEQKPRKKKENRRLVCRISCRLEDSVYDELQRNIKADGYATMQDALTDIVKRYNRQKKVERNERNNYNSTGCC